ncbi:hypothetical protein ACIRD3_18905 [Kitasatospora sp. NPDC093550]|uniref:hypothetical protein n=1 Tax=Kitasatospora sp. NPDC093550 TaxID=3364089 RepID=UPI0037F8BBC5
MTTILPLPDGLSIFRDDEPVIQSNPLLPGAVSPRFGDRACWDFNGVLRKAPNRPGAAMRVLLRGLDGEWNLLARELAMIWFNPRHPNLLERRIHLKPTPHSPLTVVGRIGHLRALAVFAADRALPQHPAQWADQDFQDYVDHRCDSGDALSVLGHIHVIKALHRLRGALACGGLPRDPWPGKSPNAVAKVPVVVPLRTPVISPETWFPLVKAAWTYIDVFAPDILRASALWRRLRDQARPVPMEEADRLIHAWLADPASRVPLHPDGSVYWSLLGYMAGLSVRRAHAFSPGSAPGRARRAAVERLVAAGRTQFGLLAETAIVHRPGGGTGPWHQGLTPRTLRWEAVALRDACYLFTAALSMMRDCEIREITRGAVVEHFGSPAVKSVKEKLDPDLPVKHWWITEPVAQAIDVASQLSRHRHLAFGSPRHETEGFLSGHVPTRFRLHVNELRHITGLPEIPDEHVTPHMFRRTMAMLTRDHPGSEIAVGMQLKHVAARALANRTTQAYMDHDPKWARHLTHAIAERRFQRLKDLFDADTRGETIGYGPGADRMRQAFAAVRHQADQLRSTAAAQRGDARVEHDLLRRTRISVRFGKLNHCTMNDDDPTGAKCIEDAIVPDGHRGPLIDRCQPSRCANSVIAPEHLPIWKAEHASLTRLRDAPGIAPGRRAHLDAQLHEVDVVIRRTER